MINYEEFSKMELRVVEILSAERIEGSDKLLKLEVSLGDDPKTPTGSDASPQTSESSGEPFDPAQGKQTRQIIAGIGKAYDPEDIIGFKIVIVANLEPRQLMGIESQGMILAAKDSEGRPILLKPEQDVPAGSSIG